MFETDILTISVCMFPVDLLSLVSMAHLVDVGMDSGGCKSMIPVLTGVHVWITICSVGCC